MWASSSLHFRPSLDNGSEHLHKKKKASGGQHKPEQQRADLLTCNRATGGQLIRPFSCSKSELGGKLAKQWTHAYGIEAKYLIFHLNRSFRFYPDKGRGTESPCEDETGTFKSPSCVERNIFIWMIPDLGRWDKLAQTSSVLQLFLSPMFMYPIKE